MLEMLQPFCARETDPREHMRAPLRAGDDAVGVNGRVAVGLFGQANLVPDGAPASEKLAKGLAKLKASWAAVPADAWRPFSDIELPKDAEKHVCKLCSGHKFVVSEKCRDCDGDGEFEHGNHTYDCKNCEGEGQIVEPSAEGEEGAVFCWECEGKGWSYKNRFLCCKVPGMPDGFGVQEIYVEKLAAIEALEWAYVHGDGVGVSCGTVYLRFAGGWGVLMPCSA